MDSIDRRSLLHTLLLAGAAVFPVTGVEALAKASATAPRLLNPARFSLLSAVADTIVPRTDTPGALDAGVPKTFDALLRNWASPRRRTELIAALDAIDKVALAKTKQSFAKLPAAKRHEVLSAHDIAALKPPSASAPPATAAPSVVDPKTGKTKQEPVQTPKQKPMTSMAAAPAVSDPAYAKLKELIVVLYYVSEPALTRELTYEHSPGEWKPSIPFTPETRASGGLGLI